ncbi:MAG: hypothetical protein CBD35_04425 [Verrucomicrobia bacterium TMED175]|nr:MAG: hypothetical protein CBD35_04425 [Verrucomicrobia bacterium TMED175]
MLPENVKILAARFPVVLDRILQAGDRSSDNFFYQEEGKTAVLMMQRGEHAFPVYGKRNKENLNKRWFEGLRLEGESLYAVTGFGDGSHIRYFLENSSTGTFCLTAEKDACMLRDTLSRIDCTYILTHERFGFGVGDLDDPFFIDIQNAAVSAVTDVNAAVFSPLQSVDESYYERMRNELLRQYLVVRPLMEVNVRTSTNIQQNSFTNLKHMATSPDVGELKDQFKDVPFVLIGAGPSLDESIDFLKKVQDKAIIVASNSPYRKLINSGIRPHLVVTADPMEPTLAGFQNVKLEHVPLACPFSAYPEIVERFSGRIISWSTLNPIADFVKKRTGKPPGTKILEQGTVSGCVLDLSKLLGCSKVLFVGQDMSVREDGQYYTADSFYADSGNHYSDTDKGHKLPGNTQESVHVESRLFVYLKTFENFVGENPSIEYRNLARTGVKIKGVPYMDFEQAFNWIGQEEKHSFDEKLEKLFAMQKDKPDLEAILNPIHSYATSLMEKALGLAIQIEMLPEKFSQPHYSENKKLKDLLKSAGEVNQIVDSDPMLWSIVFEGKTKSELITYKRIIRDIDSSNKTWAAIQRNKEYFWALSEGCYWLLNEFDNLKDKTSSKPEIASS